MADFEAWIQAVTPSGDVPVFVAWDQIFGDVRQRCTEMVSESFRERLLGLPRIAEVVEGLKNG